MNKHISPPYKYFWYNKDACYSSSNIGVLPFTEQIKQIKLLFSITE